MARRCIVWRSVVAMTGGSRKRKPSRDTLAIARPGGVAGQLVPALALLPKVRKANT